MKVIMEVHEEAMLFLLTSNSSKMRSVFEIKQKIKL